MISSATAALLMTAALGGSPRGVVLDFSATWCGPCQQMNPIVSRLERQGYSIRKVDVDKEPELTRRFGVTSIPAFVLVVDGKEVTRITGKTSEEQLRRLLAQIPSDPPPVAATPPSRQQAPGPRNSQQPSRVASADTALPADTAGQRRPAPARLAQAEEPAEDSEPAGSGNLFSRLWGRKKDAAAQDQPRNIRATDGQLEEPINLLPVRNPLRASVRLHVTINGQTSVGSGTAIDSRPGRTIVVTCGHLFKGWNDQSRIKVDVFAETGTQEYVGRMISYDVAADVGIITLNTDEYIATAQVPDANGRPQTRDEVVNIGCSGGAPPTQERVQVTALNYFEGPDNIECTGVPVQGRSGGGLFNREGQLVGICIGADAERQRGAYAGLLAIHDQLDEAGLTALYRPSPPASDRQMAVAADTGGNRPHAGRESFTEGFPPRAQPSPTSQPPREQVAPASGAALTSADDAEVICIIRDRSQPGAPSRVVIIDRASQTFLDYLGGEVRQTAMSSQPEAPRTQRQPSQQSSRYAPLADPGTVFHTAGSSRPLFTTPDRGRPSGQRSRSLSLQPTSLEEVFVPERYVRTQGR